MQLVDRLQKRGYPQRFARKLANRLKFTDRTRLLEKVDDDATTTTTTTIDDDDTSIPPPPKKRKRHDDDDDENRKDSPSLVFVNTYCPWLAVEALVLRRLFALRLLLTIESIDFGDFNRRGCEVFCQLRRNLDVLHLIWLPRR